MNKSFLLIILLAFTFSAARSVDLNTFFKDSDAFFKRYVHDGKVMYKQIRENNAEIQKLYSEINTMNLSSASEEAKKAFYINAYNLIVIYQVSKYYPLKSALDQSGFFDRVKHKVAGENITLNYLEIKKLTLVYKDPKIHFALACAATSCPPLANFGYLPDRLESQLEARTKLSVNNADWLKVDRSSKKVLLSKIFDWYRKDFTMNGQTLVQFINKYRDTSLPANYEVGFYEYDWSLNDG